MNSAANANKIFLCRCEDVTLQEFHQAYDEGFTEMESLKRYTGLGTGFCQGKGCLSEAAGELAQLRELPPGDIRLTNIRPPAEPLTFGQLAGLDLAAGREESPLEESPLKSPTREDQS